MWICGETSVFVCVSISNTISGCDHTISATLCLLFFTFKETQSQLYAASLRTYWCIL